jgi:hypothetical protein
MYEGFTPRINYFCSCIVKRQDYHTPHTCRIALSNQSASPAILHPIMWHHLLFFLHKQLWRMEQHSTAMRFAEFPDGKENGKYTNLWVCFCSVALLLWSFSFWCVGGWNLVSHGEKNEVVVFEIVVLRKALGLERREATGAWRKLQSNELHNWHSSTVSIRYTGWTKRNAQIISKICTSLRESKWLSVSQKILRILRNAKAHCRTSQVLATCPYPEPARSCPCPHIPLPEDPSQLENQNIGRKSERKSTLVRPACA